MADTPSGYRLPGRDGAGIFCYPDHLVDASLRNELNVVMELVRSVESHSLPDRILSRPKLRGGGFTEDYSRLRRGRLCRKSVPSMSGMLRHSKKSGVTKE